MGRGPQGQGTRDGCLPFKDQVPGEGQIPRESAFPVQRRAPGTVSAVGRARALSSTSFEEATIDVSFSMSHIYSTREHMIRYDHLPRSVEFKESADGTRVRVAAIDVLIETVF